MMFAEEASKLPQVYLACTVVEIDYERDGRNVLEDLNFIRLTEQP